MKVLIIPVQESILKDKDKIFNALNKAGEQLYVDYLRSNMQWAEVTKDDPYVEIRMEQGEE